MDQVMPSSTLIPTVDGLTGTWSPPADDGAAIIILGGSEGGGAVARDLASVLWRPRLGVLALSYFGDADLPPRFEDVPIEYFERAVTWLRMRAANVCHGIGIVGYSVGAVTALTVAARLSAIGAVVGLMPGSHVFQGIGQFGTTNLRPSFTEGGLPVPYLPYDLSCPFLNVHDLYCRTLALGDRVPAAAIPVERIAGPILLVSASDDETWPSAAMAETLMKRLDSYRFSHARQHFEIEGGHRAILPMAPSRFPTQDQVYSTIVDFLASSLLMQANQVSVNEAAEALLVNRSTT